MTKIAFALLLAPALYVPAFAQQKVDPWTAAGAAACFAGKETKPELMEAIACLKSNPIAGADLVKKFKEAHAGALEADAELGAALAQLERQKAARLYLKYTGASYTRGGRPEFVFMVVESAKLGGGKVSEAVDLFAPDLKLIHTSVLFGQDKTVPFQQVSSFGYRQGNTRGIGEFKTKLIDNTEIIDKSYASDYPLRAYQGADKWYAVMRLSGTIYPSRRKDGLDIELSALSMREVVFLSQEEGSQLAAKYEANYELMLRMDAQAERAAAERIKADAERARLQTKNYIDQERRRKAPLLAEMARAKLGTEDACKRVRPSPVDDPDDDEIECQFGGKISVADLKGAGWLVVNRQRNKYGVVEDYYIRKAR